MLNYGGLGLGLIFTAKDMATATMRNVDHELRSVSDTADAASRRFESSMRLMRTGLAGLGIGTAMAGSLALVGKAAFDTSAQFKQITKTFEVFLGSADKATQHVEELQKFAETTPFEFLDLTQYSRQLQAYGFQVQEVIPMLTAAGNAAAAMQDPMALERIIRALGQVRAKGRLMGEELMQLTETGLPVYEILQEQLGLTADQVGKIAQQGIPAQKAIEAILTGLTERYGGMMGELMKTPQGILSNMRDMLTRLRRGIGDVFYDEVVTVLQNALATLSALGAEGVMKGIGEGFRGIVAVVKPAVDAVLGLVRGVAKFIEQRPWIASFAVTFAGVSAVVLMVAGSFLFLRGVIGVIPMLLQKIGLSGRFAIGSLAWPVLVVTAAITGLRFAVERNIAGIGTLWRGLATLIANTRFDPQTGWVSALPEALRNELQRLNLLDFAVKVWMFTVRAREFLQGFVQGVRGFVRDVREALQPIGAAFLDVARAVTAPFVRAGVDLTKTASGLPIASVRDFGVQVGQAFERALPFIRGFASGVAVVMRTAGAVLGPTVRVVVAAFRLLGEVISWVANRFARSGRDLPADRVSTFGKLIGGLVASLLALKGLAVVKLTVSLAAANALGAMRTLLGPVRVVKKALLDLPNVLLNVGAKFDGLAKTVAKFDPRAMVTGLQKIGTALPTKVVNYFKLLKDGASLAGEGVRNFGRAIANAGKQTAQFALDVGKAIVRTVAFGARLLWTGIKAVATFVAGLVKSSVAAVSSFVPAISSAAASAWAFASALLANPITWVIAGIIALGSAIYLLWKNWDRVTVALGRAWAKTKEFVANLSPTVVKALTAFLPIVGIPLLIIRNWDKIKAFFQNLWRGIVAGASSFITWIRGIPSWFAGLPGRIGAALSGLWTTVSGFFRNLWANVVDSARGFWAWVQGIPDWFAGLPGRVATVLSGLWTTIASFFASLPERSAEWGRNLVASFIEGIKSALGALGDIAGKAAGLVKRFLGIESPAEAGPLATSHLWGLNLAMMFAQGMRKGIPLITAASVELASALSGGMAAAEVPAPKIPEIAPVQLRMLAPEVPALRLPGIEPAGLKMLEPEVTRFGPYEAGSVRAGAVAPATGVWGRRLVPTMPVRPVVIPKAEEERRVPAMPKQAEKPEIIQLVVDGRVLAEVVRNIEREDQARSAPW